MTFDEQRASATQTGNSGPLERISFGRDESGEKSLLELIEERSADRSRSGPAEQPSNDLANGIDDVDEAHQPDIDQMIMRLGGNGF
ncbi:MAG: hypothetical protein OQK55_06505 [Thermoanaerobaculales bacterium]|nr:hypothetical protein [Thermoanaerobaculales bacterium]